MRVPAASITTPATSVSETCPISPIKRFCTEYFKKNPTPMTRITIPMRNSQLLATAYSSDTPSGRWSCPTMIQFQIFWRASLAATS